jgi:flagellar basal body rod protein FlgG
VLVLYQRRLQKVVAGRKTEQKSRSDLLSYLNFNTTISSLSQKRNAERENDNGICTMVTIMQAIRMYRIADRVIERTDEKRIRREEGSQ